MPTKNIDFLSNRFWPCFFYSVVKYLWKQICPVPVEHEFSLKKRYKKVLTSMSSGRQMKL